jgi:NifU-like protein
VIFVYLVSNVYPKRVLERLRSSKNVGHNDRPNAIGKSIALECGTFVAFEISINPETKLIEKITFISNGCGYMVSAADLLATKFRTRFLTELHALREEPISLLTERLYDLPPERHHCVEAVIAALREAFADFRRRQVDEFAGEKALICTCFGVTEETIELTISRFSAETTEQVGQLCKAGTGCGSCQMTIQEIIDSVKRERSFDEATVL